MHSNKLIRAGAALALLLTSVAVSPALATPPSSPAPMVASVVNGHFGTLGINTAGDKTDKWGLHLKTLDDTDIGADRLTFPPGAFSGWHTHPSPVFVTVTQGTIEWYDAATCTATTYSAGESFIEPQYRAHNVRNPAAAGGSDAIFVAVVIKPAGFVGPAFRLDRDVPSSC